MGTRTYGCEAHFCCLSKDSSVTYSCSDGPLQISPKALPCQWCDRGDTTGPTVPLYLEPWSHWCCAPGLPDCTTGTHVGEQQGRAVQGSDKLW